MLVNLINSDYSIFLEFPCMPPIGSSIMLSTSEYDFDNDEEKKSAKELADFVNKICEKDGCGSPLFLVKDIVFGPFYAAPILYIEHVE